MGEGEVMPTARIPTTNPDAWIASMKAKGIDVKDTSVKLVAVTESEGKAKQKKKDMLASVFVPPNAFLVGIEVVSVNAAKSMKATMGRKAGQRAAVCGLLGKHLDVLVPYSQAFHAGRPIVVKLARLGGRGLDGDNLQGAMKFVRDSVADMLGANDKSPLIRWDYDQFDNPKIGVRVILEMEE